MAPIHQRKHYMLPYFLEKNPPRNRGMFGLWSVLSFQFGNAPNTDIGELLYRLVIETGVWPFKNIFIDCNLKQDNQQVSARN